MTAEDLFKNPNQKLRARELSYLAAFFRVEAWNVLYERGTGHWGGAASAMELTTSLYFNRMNIRSEDPSWEDRDRFILSKGHASINLYTVLAYRGFFSPEILPSFRTLGGTLQGHPSMMTTPGVDLSTGALGHGLSVGLGMALAARHLKKNYWTYVLTGEGCLNEGTSWEALMCAAKYRPERFVLLIDYNKVQLDGYEEDIMPLEPLRDKLVSFGWNVPEQSFDGNNTGDILKSFVWLDNEGPWPKAIIYKTTKGMGVSFTENDNHWHGAKIDDESFKKGLLELGSDLSRREIWL